MRFNFLRTLIAAAVVAAPVAPVAAQLTGTSGPPTIDIGPLGNDIDFGPVPTAVAQTFTPAGGFNYLQTFSFFISQGFGTGGSTLALNASVFRFDTDHFVGSALFSTGTFFGNDSPTDQQVTFGSSEHPLNWFLAPGDVYALVISSLNGSPQPDHATVFVGAVGDVYPGGALFVSLATDPGTLGDAGAFVDAGAVFGVDPLDLAGSATFTSDRAIPTPEPSTTILLVSGLIPLSVVVRRRRAR